MPDKIVLIAAFLQKPQAVYGDIVIDVVCPDSWDHCQWENKNVPVVS